LWDEPMKGVADVLRVALLVLMVALPAPSAAQRAFRDLDIGHPVRIQDPSTPNALELELYAPTAALEVLPNAVRRWRSEPGVALGLGWRSSLEVFAPVVFRERPVSPRIGLAGTGVALMRVWTPAPVLGLGLVVNSVLPVGSAASARSTYAARGLASLALGNSRLLANATAGTYAISGRFVCNPFIARILGVPCDGSSSPALPPCNIAIRQTAGESFVASPSVMQCAASSAVAAPTLPVLKGGRYQVAFGMDRTFVRQSMLIVADVFAERFEGLLPRTDLTAEAGIRRALGKRTVAEASAARHFSGNSVGWQFTAGFAIEYAARRRSNRTTGADSAIDKRVTGR
jgi:hypothetical protein